MKTLKRHFIIARVSPDKIPNLTVLLSQFAKFQIPHVPYDDFHLTLLYFEPVECSSQAIIDHFKPEINLLSKFELTVNKLLIEEGQAWASLKKDVTLRSIHRTITRLLPKHFGGVNLDFEAWNPHVMIAKQLPDPVSFDKKVKILSSLDKELETKNLEFDKFFLTKQNPNSFEILYER